MSAFEYIKDKVLLLLLHMGCMFASTIFLFLTNYPKDYCVVILICWCLVLAVWLLTDFFMRRNYFRKIEMVMEKLDQRYL